MSDEIPFPNINFERREDSVTHDFSDDVHKRGLRDDLIKLAEKKKIRNSVAYIKKCGHKQLERIKYEYDRKQLDETNDLITQSLVSRFSELMETLDLVDEEQQLGKRLDNDIVKRDLKDIIGRVTPYVPYIGLLCGGVIVGVSMMTRNKNGEQKQQAERPEPERSESERSEQEAKQDHQR